MCTKNRNLLLLVVLIVLSILVTYYCQRDCLINTFVVHDDVTQYVPAAYALRPGALHDALINNDLIIKYMVLKDSPGHLYFYHIFGYIIDPLLLTKILPFFLCAFCAAAFFYWGRLIRNSEVGFIGAIFFIFYLWTSKFGFLSGGLPKAFAFPLLLLFIIFLLKNKWWGLVSVLILQVLFYPAIAIISLTIYFFVLLDTPRPQFRQVLIFVSISVFTLLLSLIIYKRSDIFLGQMVNSYKDMVRMPEFWAGGRDTLFTGNIKDFLMSEDASGIWISTAFPVLVSLFLLSIFYLGRSFIQTPRIIFYIVLSGLVLFLAAWAFLFRLFFPGRYLEFTLPIFAILIISSAFEKLLSRFKSGFAKRVFLSFILIGAIFIHLPFLQKNLTDYKRPYFAFIRTLADRSLFAGHPCELDAIPSFTKKRVLVQFEVSTAWYKNYYAKIKERTYDFFKAYYASSLQDVEGFFNKHEVDYLIVNKAHFQEDYLKKGDFYIQPFNEDIRKMVRNNSGNFILASSDIDKYKVFEDQNYYILKLRRGSHLGR